MCGQLTQHSQLIRFLLTGNHQGNRNVSLGMRLEESVQILVRTPLSHEKQKLFGKTILLTDSRYRFLRRRSKLGINRQGDDTTAIPRAWHKLRQMAVREVAHAYDVIGSSYVLEPGSLFHCCKVLMISKSEQVMHGCNLVSRSPARKDAIRCMP